MDTATDSFSRRLQHLRHALEHNNAPLDALASLVDALLESGDRAGALQTYRRYASRFENGDSRARLRLRALHERVLWSAPPAARQTNVPTSRYVIVGRERETHAIAEQLHSTPVLCITGPGGVGKTRIALEVARRVLTEYPDGVWWVDFSPIEDGAYCAEHVAHTLDLSLFQTTATSLAEALSGKTAVLVLDRCERIAENVRALVNEIRARCPKLRVVLTSRFAIGADDEREIRVAPLDVPADSECDRTAALQYPSVQLFVERAAAVDPRFALTDANAAAVAALCAKLGGLPFAIELAASSAAHVPLSHIEHRINARADGLHETIAWSYDLLSEAERRSLRNLSIFVAPFTFDEAAALSASDISLSLKRLIDASLVQTRIERGTPEYYLLDTTRDFAHAELQSCNEHVDAYRSLLRYYAKIAAPDNGTLEMLDPMFRNVANVLTTLASDAAVLQERLILLGAPGTRFGMLGHVEEMAKLCETTLRHADPDVRGTYAYADAMRTYAWLSNRHGRFRESIDLAKEAAAIAMAVDDPALAVRTLSIAYVASISVGEYDAARRFGDEALELARKTADPATIANALRSSGGARVAVGDFLTALPLYDELLELDIARIPQTVLAMALHDYAIARLHLGHATVARTLAERAMHISVGAGDYGTQADVHNVLGSIALNEGKLEEALQQYRAALTLENRPGAHPLTIARTLEGCAASALRDDQIDVAAEIFGHAEQMRRRVRSPLQPFERDKAQALRTALASRLGEERFEACLLSGRTKNFRDVCLLVARLGAGSAPPEKAERFAALTSREREIAELAAAGASNREIAAQLFVSVRTVENHLATIYRKLGIKTRAEL